jgi:hypothetical protein
MPVRFSALIAFTILATGPTPTWAQQPDITLKKVKYAELGKVVRDLKGKVVVVDFWATY